MNIKRLTKHKTGFKQRSRRGGTLIASTTITKEAMKCLHSEAKLRRISVSAILADMISSRYRI